ncbi:hypothetical protein VAR608DRAFT_4877 [Variovorax sp. HW608]|uniref:hypothetical protein n=1 Tax=Variovorax sp. HW608 TaxID=1034889 RepID=UPI00081FA79F|nr:hypothetical protein [Variovorax sp. HW608]SCK49065.1 hypothetical protein VAR608DRAFT_4877 [Variovorax sp. HW608]
MLSDAILVLAEVFFVLACIPAVKQPFNFMAVGLALADLSLVIANWGAVFK